MARSSLQFENFLEVFIGREKSPDFEEFLVACVSRRRGILNWWTGGFSSTRRVIFYRRLEFFARFLRSAGWKAR